MHQSPNLWLMSRQTRAHHTSPCHTTLARHEPRRRYDDNMEIALRTNRKPPRRRLFGHATATPIVAELKKRLDRCQILSKLRRLRSLRFGVSHTSRYPTHRRLCLLDRLIARLDLGLPRRTPPHRTRFVRRKIPIHLHERCGATPKEPRLSRVYGRIVVAPIDVDRPRTDRMGLHEEYVQMRQYNVPQGR